MFIIFNPMATPGLLTISNELKKSTGSSLNSFLHLKPIRNRSNGKYPLLRLKVTDLIEELEKRFISDFGASVCKVLFFDGEINKLPKGRVVGKDLAIKSLGELIKPNQIYSGPIDVDSKAKKFLFGNKESIKECVLVSLKTKSVTAILMLGSDTNDKYSPEKDSLFLEFISDVASSLIDRHNN